MGRHSAHKSAVTAPVAVRDHARAHDAPTERIAVVPALPSRKDLRVAKQVAAKRRFRTRASMVAATSLMAGFGASTVLTGTGQPAAAVDAAPPVISSLEKQATAVSTVPVTIADNDEAADIAQIRSAQQIAEQRKDEEPTCEPESANGLLSAVMDTEEVQAVIFPVADGTYRNSSHYGIRWSPFGDGYHNHAGTDFAAELGTPIYAVADGTVEHVGLGKDGRSNNLIIIKHDVDGTVFWTWYVHMYDNGLHVEVGDEVEAGQHIADVGNNGRSTGPHLHFEVHTDSDGTTVEPLGFLERLGATDVSELC